MHAMADDIVEEIKLRTDLVELIQSYGIQLRRSGRTHKGLCPFHGEKTPSFHVDGERGFYKCYGCGKGGDCFSFLRDKEGLSFPEAGELLARRLGLEWQRKGESPEVRSERQRVQDVTVLAERFFRERLMHAPGVLRYLEERGLSRETIEQFGLGYAPPGYEALLTWFRQQKVSLEDAMTADLLLKGEHGLRDRFVDRVMFPICDLEGRPIAFGGRTMRPDGQPKYLNTAGTPIFEKGRTLYGLHLARPAIVEAGFAVAVEGYMDVIALHQAGIANTVASLGTAITETHVGILRRFRKGDAESELVICYDGDSAGMRAVERAGPMFEEAGCNVRIASLPEGEDPDTYVKKYGADALRALLNRALPLLDYELNRLRARYNLSDPSARLPFMREAARLVARSGSSLVRQEYAGRLTRLLERLSDEWFPGDPHQAMQARFALSQEIARLHRNDGSARRGVAAAPVAPPGVGGAKGARAMAERYVLRAALTEYRWAEVIAGRISEAYFSEETLRGIARDLLGHNESVENSIGELAVTPDLWARVERLRNDPASAGIVSELLMDETPLSDDGLEACLQSLEHAGKLACLKELRRAYEAGEFTPDDPRREEYLQLRKELGGHQKRED